MADPLSESYATFPSDSDNSNYAVDNSNSNDSDEPTSSDSSPMILYSPPTFWSILRGAGINLLLPFVNGLMLGFGELFAHEAAFRLGWGKTKVRWRRGDDKEMRLGCSRGVKRVPSRIQRQGSKANMTFRCFLHIDHHVR